MQGPIADEFISSANWLVTLGSHIGPGDLEQPGLGVWDVRSLLGHAARALVTVIDYISRPVDHIDTPTTIDYLSASKKADPAAIAARGVASGVELGDDPAATVNELAVRAIDLVGVTAADTILATIAGGMTLEAYLPTRTVELVVHGCDLAQAIGADPDPPAQAAASVARLLTETYVAIGRSATLCLALAGRPMGLHDLVLWPSTST